MTEFLSRDFGYWLQQGLSREQALCAAHERSGISMTQLAGELGVSVGWVSKLIQRAERQERGGQQCAN